MEKQSYGKPPITYEEQLQQLKSRGLRFSNEERALHLLENISYYRLSAYWYPLLDVPKERHSFKDGASFEQAFEMYKFDRELRQLVMSELEKIEVAVRAKMIYVLAHANGPFWFQDKELFLDQYALRRSLKKLREEYSRSDEDFIKAFRKKYAEALPPSWMIFEISSFGNLSHFYSNLAPGRTKRLIAHYFGLDDKTFQSWLHSLTYVRNLCAHHSRFWNKRMSISPSIPKAPKFGLIRIKRLPAPAGVVGFWKINDRAYYVLCVIQYLLNIVNPKNNLRTKLDQLFTRYPDVDRSALGYPKGWENEPVWVK